MARFNHTPPPPSTGKIQESFGHSLSHTSSNLRRITSMCSRVGRLAEVWKFGLEKFAAIRTWQTSPFTSESMASSMKSSVMDRWRTSSFAEDHQEENGDDEHDDQLKVTVGLHHLLQKLLELVGGHGVLGWIFISLLQKTCN